MLLSNRVLLLCMGICYVFETSKLWDHLGPFEGSHSRPPIIVLQVTGSWVEVALFHSVRRKGRVHIFIISILQTSVFGLPNFSISKQTNHDKDIVVK